MPAIAYDRYVRAGPKGESLGGWTSSLRGSKSGPRLLLKSWNACIMLFHSSRAFCVLVSRSKALRICSADGNGSRGGLRPLGNFILPLPGNMPAKSGGECWPLGLEPISCSLAFRLRGKSLATKLHSRPRTRTRWSKVPYLYLVLAGPCKHQYQKLLHLIDPVDRRARGTLRP